MTFQFEFPGSLEFVVEHWPKYDMFDDLNMCDIQDVFQLDEEITLTATSVREEPGSPNDQKKNKRALFKTLKTENKTETEAGAGKTITCHFNGCEEYFTKRKKYEKHMKKHYKRNAEYVCEFAGCNKIYKSKENLVLHHKNKHLKMKPYCCRFCKTSFSHRNGKLYHERRFHSAQCCDINVCPATTVSSGDVSPPFCLT